MGKRFEFEFQYGRLVSHVKTLFYNMAICVQNAMKSGVCVVSSVARHIFWLFWGAILNYDLDLPFVLTMLVKSVKMLIWFYKHLLKLPD